MRSYVLSTVFLSLLAGCTSQQKASTIQAPPVSTIQKDDLSRETAQLRFSQVKDVSYRLDFKLDQERTEFTAKANIQFKLNETAPKDRSLLLDFLNGHIQSISVNGQAWPSAKISGRYNNYQLQIPHEELKAGENTIEIAYEHAYSTEGNGLHRFVDPVDHKVYIYSHLEPYYAHYIFPCFDQPDLKATFQASVSAPKDWTVITNTNESRVNVKGKLRLWTFPVTARMSTYLFALHAGPYSSWTGKAGTIPTRLFARRSLAKFVDAKEWLDVTAKGLEFYQKTFNVPYPFHKYDQIVVPDFNAGAMENIGAVTFTENYIFRSKVTQDQHRGRASVILHEMAHMWFGDLVTMKWWDDLWLNESFATYMSSWAIDRATAFDGSWLSFFLWSKQSAYREDQMVTTHPILVPVPDTDTALTIFDGITYGKGASVLKQMAFWLGEDNFKKGLKLYFDQHAFSNATLADFIQAMQSASGRDMSNWQRVWLQTPGLNTVQVQYLCDSDRKTIAHMSIRQGLADFSPELRPHRTRIALYEGANLKKPARIFDLAFDGSETIVPAAAGQPCPNFVYPNYDDQDVAKVILDDASLQFIEKHLKEFEEPLVRGMAWYTLFEMTRDAKISAQRYADIVLEHVSSETNSQILSWILNTYHESEARSLTAVRMMTPVLQAQYTAKLETLARTNLEKASPGSDNQLIWFQSYLESLQSGASSKDVRAWLAGSKKIPGLAIDQERRWELIQTLARMGEEDASALIEKELKRDPSDLGHRQAIATEVMIPKAQLKEKWLKTVSKTSNDPKDQSMKLAWLRVAMRNFYVSGQSQFTSSAADVYASALPRLARSESEEYLHRFTQSMFPPTCDARTVGMATELLKENPNLSVTIQRGLKKSRQEEERCIRARELSAKEAADVRR